jgi:alpha-1,3-mannosylglycoprotein beta-1,4-N-acetylglucosaminyltransferase A/B
LTLNDDLKRTAWRSKQNLDFAYLMMFAQRRGKYYLHLVLILLISVSGIISILDLGKCPVTM